MRLVAPLRVSDQESGRWPERCALSGVPTTITVDLVVVERPAWPFLLLPLGVLSFLVARYLTTTSMSAHVAISEAAWRRYRHRVRTILVATVALAGVVVFFDPTIALVVVLAGIVARVQASRRDWISVTRGGDYFFVRNVHPAYLAEALALDRRTTTTD